MDPQKEYTRFKIEAQSESWMRMTLWFWIVLWTLLGIYVLYKIVFDLQDSGQRIFFAVYLAFWLYFEWKGVEALVFKLVGFELVTISRDKITLEVNYGWRKKRFSTERKNIRGIRKVTRNRKSISEGFAKSFWTVANQQLEFYGNVEPMPFGMHLSQEQANSLMNQIKRKL